MQTRVVATVIVAAAAVAVISGARRQTYFVPQYDFAAVHTWRFASAARASDDVLAHNPVWAEIVTLRVARSLQHNGYAQVSAEPDVLIGVWLGLADSGRGRQHRPTWPGGWRASGGWEVPASEATLALAVSDAPSGTLVWRGVAARTIDIERPTHALHSLVDGLVERFVADVKRRSLTRD